MEIFWNIPTQGDGHFLGTPIGARALSPGYMQQVAQATDQLGYHGVLVPTGRVCEDAWVVASFLAASTRQLKFIVAARPQVASPTVLARMAASLDRVSEGRVILNVVTGGDPGELAADGVFLDHDTRYAVTDEFLVILHRLFAGETVDFEGQHLKVWGAKLLMPQVQIPRPLLFLGGSSEPAREIAARQIDSYLTWGEPLDEVREKIADVRRRAAAYSRDISFGIRFFLVVRETEKAAWAAADDLLRHVDQSAIDAAQAHLATMDSEGQRRMTALHRGRREDLVIGPNLWAGIGLVRGHAGTALVGTPQQVAARLLDYADLGIDRFIVSGYPGIEEAYRFAEQVFPLLPLSPRSTAANAARGPVGEALAGAFYPAPERESAA